MKTKALYACGSNLLSHIAPRNGDGAGETEEPDYGGGLVATPRCVFSGLSEARVLYVGWGDVLCMSAMPPWRPPPLANLCILYPYIHQRQRNETNLVFPRNFPQKEQK